MITFGPSIVMIGLMLINVPVMVAIACGSLLFFLLQSGIPLEIFAQRLVASTASFPLVAIPMFTLAGVVMNEAGITRRLLALAEVLVGHLVGALAQTNILLAFLIGGLSASTNATASVQAKLVGGEMIRRGYRPDFTAALIASAAVIDGMIPPALGFIIYGYLADVSVGQLFIAGIVPGILLVIVLMVVVGYLARRHGYQAERDKPASTREILLALRDAIWALMIPIFVVLGLRSGHFTPTETGVITVVFSLIVGLFFYREIKISRFWAILTEAMLASAGVMAIICAADAFSFYLVIEQIPVTASQALASVTTNPTLMLLLMVGFMLLIGTILESVAGILLLVPIFTPLAASLGIDLVQLGVIFCLVFAIGALHPPVGTLMFITCGALNVPIWKFTIAVLPFLAAELFVLLLIVFFPQIATWLPGVLM